MRSKPSKRVSLPKTARTSDAEEVARRKERARTAKYVIRNLQPTYPVFSNFEVLSDSGKTYEVEIRDLAWRQVFCNCVDFRINKLGTCKHVEAVVEYLKRRVSSEYDHAMESVSTRIDIVPGELPGSLSIERGAQQLPPLLKRLLSAEDSVNALNNDAFLRAAKAYEPQVRISLELRDALAREQAQRERLDLRRDYEESVRRGDAPPSETLVPLYPYQREGMLHLAFQERAVVADEFGLNRAAQAIGASLLLRRLNRAQHVLIITSASLIPLWETEIKEHADAPYLVVEGVAKRRMASYRLGSFFTVVRFEDAVADIEAINAILKPDVVILDEAQRIRDWHSPTAMRVKQLESRYGFVLTGMEFGESPDEIYSIMSFVDPTVLGPLFRFNRDYYIFDESQSVVGVQNLDKLREKVRSYFLRRSRIEVASQIPKRTERTYFVRLTKRQRELYARHETTGQSLLKAAKTGKVSEGHRENLMRAMGMLRMICASPAILGDKDKGSAKLQEIEAILRECLQQPLQKIILFSEWERMLQLVEDICVKLGIGFTWNKGALAGNQRRKEIERFNEDDTCRVLLSTDAVASGIQLKGAGVLINCDIPWSTEKLEQRIARVQSLDPNHPLSVIHLVAADTVEQKIFDRWTRSITKRGDQIETQSAVHSGKAGKKELGHMATALGLSDEEEPAALSDAQKAEAGRFLAEAQRKLKLARILKGEDFPEETAKALTDAFLMGGRAMAAEKGLPSPAFATQLVAEPYSKHLDRYALALWKWMKDPVQFLDSGMEAVAGFLKSSGWKDAR
ncbi:MAG: DEAD/DEAH box helicase [Chthoniobacterales bacterium]